MGPETSALRMVSVRGRTVPWLAMLKVVGDSTSLGLWRGFQLAQRDGKTHRAGDYSAYQ
jgi:hypothetical protein